MKQESSEKIKKLYEKLHADNLAYDWLEANGYHPFGSLGGRFLHINGEYIRIPSFYIAERRKPDIGNAGAFAFREVDRGADVHQIKICKQTHFLTVSNCTQDYKGQKSPDSGHFVAS